MREHRSSGSAAPKGMHVLARLLEDRRINPIQQEGVIRHAKRSGLRLEEALVDMGLIAEAELLRFLAEVYGTRFVSTERLSKARVSAKALSLVSQRVAEQLQVFPILFDEQTQLLSVVVAAPGEDDVEKQVQVTSGVRTVRGYVARPAAIAAAVRKFYRRDPRAFDELLREPNDAFAHAAYDPSVGNSFGYGGSSTGDFGEPPTSVQDLAITWSGMAIANPPSVAASIAPASEASVPASNAPPMSPVVNSESHLETLHVLVSLLERKKEGLRGHSSQVARWCRRVAERVGMSALDRYELLVAAYLHDVGKSESAYHLTALNVARYEGHRLQAMKAYETPVKLFAADTPSLGTALILCHMYERFDGQGFPDRLAGKEIPYGSRVLAMVETFVDLIGNPRNPYRRLLTTAEAVEVTKGLSGQLFDPTLADILRHVALGESGEEHETRAHILLVDPDPEETTVLEMRLLEYGFAVDVVKNFASAKSRLETPPQLIISEVDFGGGSDGFDLLKLTHEIPTSDRPGFIFLTSRSDRQSVARGFELGASDYLAKPASAEVVATKAGQVIESGDRPTAGVSGSLREMSLPDVVQILANGRKSGLLQLVSDGERGEVHFSEGQIFDARFGEVAGADAFYAMLRLTDGNFTLDPSFKPGERQIHVSAEGLLLEGMRRLDEGLT